MDLSVSFERRIHIDFTVPFMDSGISLAVKGESGKENVFFFLSPFSRTIWMMIIIAVLAIALLQNFFSKVSPYGKYGRRVHAMQVRLQTC